MRRLLVGFACSLCLSGAAHAAVVVDHQFEIAPAGGVLGGPHTPTFAAGGPSSTDLLNGDAPSASAGNFTLEASAGLPALTDGLVTTYYGDGTGASNHAAYATAGDGGGAGTTVTYALGGPHNLSSIVIYGGWNDAGRDQQRYDVLTSTDGTTFNILGSADRNPGVQGTDITPVSSRIAFSENALPNLASGVTHLRVNFLAVENGYTGYAEIDVFGQPVPEPASAALATLGLLGAVALRRRVAK